MITSIESVRNGGRKSRRGGNGVTRGGLTSARAVVLGGSEKSHEVCVFDWTKQLQ